MGFLEYYRQLALEPDNAGLPMLLYLAPFDERIYKVLAETNLFPAVVALLPNPQAAYVLSRGMVYDDINSLVLKDFIRICSLLSRYTTTDEAATLCELIGNCGLPEQYRLQMFNFSETYRHMILSRSYFPQRAVLKLLAYIFCDDMMSDAVAQLQFKSDILNHVNKVFVESPDFVSWRFSVRVLSIAGGFMEDRSDVEMTEKLSRIVTKAIPDFFTYFVAAFVYGMFRQYPRRVRGVVPWWLCRQRALFSSLFVGLLGVFFTSYTEWRLYKQRCIYEQRKCQEFRRRRGAKKRNSGYQNNPFFDDLDGQTQRIFAIQKKTYMIVGGVLAMSMLPLSPVKFPKWMGDVPFRHPTIPRLFPGLLGMPTATRCLVPFAVVPFLTVSVVNGGSCAVSWYDRYINLRMKMWHRKHDACFDASTMDAQVDVPKEAAQKKNINEGF